MHVNMLRPTALETVNIFVDDSAKTISAWQVGLR
jgi:hypothetical protein